MNIQRIAAIFEKDLKDFMKNSMLVFLPFLPIFMAFIFSKTGENLEETLPAFLVYVVIGVTYGGVACNFIMYSMAEEKEKNTLRGLMLSPASFIDIIVGKSLVAACITFITLFVSLFIVGIDPYLNAKSLLVMCTPKVRPNLTLGVFFYMAKYNKAFKLAVVKAYLKGQDSYETIAKKFNIASDSTIHKWVKGY